MDNRLIQMNVKQARNNIFENGYISRSCVSVSRETANALTSGNNRSHSISWHDILTGRTIAPTADRQFKMSMIRFGGGRRQKARNTRRRFRGGNDALPVDRSLYDRCRDQLQ
jgi:hypothetical protein